jgi:hypothetical protein
MKKQVDVSSYTTPRGNITLRAPAHTFDTLHYSYNSGIHFKN